MKKRAKPKAKKPRRVMLWCSECDRTGWVPCSGCCGKGKREARSEPSQAAQA